MAKNKPLSFLSSLTSLGTSCFGEDVVDAVLVELRTRRRRPLPFPRRAAVGKYISRSRVRHLTGHVQDEFDQQALRSTPTRATAHTVC
mmetsp:Transcript_38590/g.152312  ORF Transcript_38590/g.152312 Transcript_38590/m.152312 type:complete len:88 (+) Transcript_38590:4791-5054(+)